jgi:hypothetical protein
LRGGLLDRPFGMLQVGPDLPGNAWAWTAASLIVTLPLFIRSPLP